MAEKSTFQRGMEAAPENGKELSHSTHANGMNEYGDDSLLMFRDNLLVLDLMTLENGTDGLSQKFGKELPPYAV